jgi:hypothetical protein
MANSRKNLGASASRHHFSVSRRVVWAASETMMVAFRNFENRFARLTAPCNMMEWSSD